MAVLDLLADDFPLSLPQPNPKAKRVRTMSTHKFPRFPQRHGGGLVKLRDPPHFTVQTILMRYSSP